MAIYLAEQLPSQVYYIYCCIQNTTMSKLFCPLLLLILLAACNNHVENNATTTTALPLQGTWKLLSGTLIEKEDTTVTDYTKGTSFIKVINATHFAFLSHSVDNKKDTAAFSAGGGRYTLQDSLYTEHLEYCNDRQWEGNDFQFTITIHNDTLTQQGVEKIDSLGVNRMNIEKYVRVKE